MRYRLSVFAAGTLATLALACGSDSTSPAATATGTVVVRLTDAPFLTDSVKSVDIFVVRVEGRVAATDSANADANLDNGSLAGWQVLASPNAAYNILALQNGVTTTLGSTTIAAGTYNGFRFIIDPSKSSVTLKNSAVLTGTSSPNVTFPSASRSGIKIVLAQPITIVGGATTTLLVDFDINNSFVMRGNSINQNGLLFKPVVKATIIDAATVNATVRVVNVTETGLNLLQNNTAVTGGSNVAFGTSSACTSVNAAAPLLSLTQVGTPLTGFAPNLTPGTSFTLIAYPTAAGGVQFATLGNTFTPTTGQVGLRVFNATTAVTGFDVYVTATGAPLTAPAFANVLAGGTTSFISVPAGLSQVRLTLAGGSVVLLDIGSQLFSVGQNPTLIIAPPAAGTLVPRAFLVPGC